MRIASYILLDFDFQHEVHSRDLLGMAWFLEGSKYPVGHIIGESVTYGGDYVAALDRHLFIAESHRPNSTNFLKANANAGLRNRYWSA